MLLGIFVKTWTYARGRCWLRKAQIKNSGQEGLSILYIMFIHMRYPYICFDFINKNIVLFCESFSAARNSLDFSNWWTAYIIPWIHYVRHARMLNDQLKKRNNTYEEERCLFFSAIFCVEFLWIFNVKIHRIIRQSCLLDAIFNIWSIEPSDPKLKGSLVRDQMALFL